MIFLLLIGLVIQLAICYRIFGKDLFSPAAIICEVFILSTLACIYNADVWGVDLALSTVFVILGGNTVFIVASAFIHRYYKREEQKNILPDGDCSIKERNRNGLSYINIPVVTIILTTVMYLVFVLVFVRISSSIIQTFDQSAIGDSSVAMQMYRKQMTEGVVDLPGWLSTARSFFEAGLFVIIFIFINNYLCDKKKKSNYLFLVCICAYLVSTVFSAQRTTILIAFIYSLFVAYVLLNRKYRFVSKINIKYIKKGLILVIAFLALFGVTRGLFGRGTNSSVVDNVTYYMGNSIEALDLYIKEPVYAEQFGEELFRVFREPLSKYGIASKPKSPHLEFRRNANGGLAGNIYTAYRYYIHDFGYASIILFQLFLAIVCGIWYERISKRRLHNIDYSFIIFSWLVSYSLFRFSIMNSFFSFFGHFFFSYWYKVLLWKILFKFKIRKRATFTDEEKRHIAKEGLNSTD